MKKHSESIEELPSMLFTGLHHAREPISYSMNIYLIVSIVYNSLRGSSDYNRVLDQSLLWFLPALNLDGYRRIIEQFEKSGNLNANIRKNRKPAGSCYE